MDHFNYRDGRLFAEEVPWRPSPTASAPPVMSIPAPPWSVTGTPSTTPWPAGRTWCASR